MRGSDEQTGSLFSYVSCEARVPADHPLRLIRAVVDEALDVLSPEFDRCMPASAGPASHPRSCCEPCCCRRSTRCAPNGS
jgi:transposase